MFVNLLTLSTCAFLLVTDYEPVASTDFDQNFFGVDFSPYVKSTANNEATRRDWMYTMDNLQTLLEVASTKFSKLKTCCVDNYFGVPYVKNSTYYTGTNIASRTAEAAALLNRAKNNNSLTVIIGVNSNYWNDNQHWQTGLKIAAEAAKIANNIYAGTVEGIYLYNFDTSNIIWANWTLSGIRILRGMTADLGLFIGTQQSCHDLPPYPPFHTNSIAKTIWSARKQMVLESDFIICYQRPLTDDVESSFAKIATNIRNGRTYVSQANPRITVMFATVWPVPANVTSLASVRNFQSYWEQANDFAKEQGIRTYLLGAFDSTSHRTPSIGWWSLSSYKLINNVSGYVEKVSALRAPVPTTGITLVSTSPSPQSAPVSTSSTLQPAFVDITSTAQPFLVDTSSTTESTLVDISSTRQPDLVDTSSTTQPTLASVSSTPLPTPALKVPSGQQNSSFTPKSNPLRNPAKETSLILGYILLAGIVFFIAVFVGGSVFFVVKWCKISRAPNDSADESLPLFAKDQTLSQPSE